MFIIMYTFIHNNILHYHNDKILRMRHVNMKFDDLAITSQWLKNVHDLSYDQC
jgi:hypothetical protein